MNWIEDKLGWIVDTMFSGCIILLIAIMVIGAGVFLGFHPEILLALLFVFILGLVARALGFRIG